MSQTYFRFHLSLFLSTSPISLPSSLGQENGWISPLEFYRGVSKREDYRLLDYSCWHHSEWDNTGPDSTGPYEGLSLTVLRPIGRGSRKLIQSSGGYLTEVELAGRYGHQLPV